jgi:hypothetical protein
VPSMMVPQRMTISCMESTLPINHVARQRDA